MAQKIQPAVFSPAPRPEASAAHTRLEAKRARIVETAMRHFAEQGYHNARIEDLLRSWTSPRVPSSNILAARLGFFWKFINGRRARSRNISIAL